MTPTPVGDVERCYRAVQGRDRRFDGVFYTAVRTTGIYCRPSCPATTPRRPNVEFFVSAAAAQLAGYRACRRCLPDATPGSPEWDVRADVAGRAMRLINDGVVERDGVSGLARRIGYTPRHLGRVLTDEVGAGPLALARARRAQTARILVETTQLPMSDIAFASGFSQRPAVQRHRRARSTPARPPSCAAGGATAAPPRPVVWTSGSPSAGRSTGTAAGLPRRPRGAGSGGGRRRHLLAHPGAAPRAGRRAPDSPRGRRGVRSRSGRPP